MSTISSTFNFVEFNSIRNNKLSFSFYFSLIGWLTILSVRSNSNIIKEKQRTEENDHTHSHDRLLFVHMSTCKVRHAFSIQIEFLPELNWFLFLFHLKTLIKKENERHINRKESVYIDIGVEYLLIFSQLNKRRRRKRTSVSLKKNRI